VSIDQKFRGSFAKFGRFSAQIDAQQRSLQTQILAVTNSIAQKEADLDEVARKVRQIAHCRQLIFDSKNNETFRANRDKLVLKTQHLTEREKKTKAKIRKLQDRIAEEDKCSVLLDHLSLKIESHLSVQPSTSSRRLATVRRQGIQSVEPVVSDVAASDPFDMDTILLEERIANRIHKLERKVEHARAVNAGLRHDSAFLSELVCELSRQINDAQTQWENCERETQLEALRHNDNVGILFDWTRSSHNDVREIESQIEVKRKAIAVKKQRLARQAVCVDHVVSQYDRIATPSILERSA
jgi:predicted  nucleic acid-binding Zn-ribbon protein